MESSADLESQLVESINSISTIKQFGIEENEKKTLYKEIENAYTDVITSKEK